MGSTARDRPLPSWAALAACDVGGGAASSALALVPALRRGRLEASAAPNNCLQLFRVFQTALRALQHQRDAQAARQRVLADAVSAARAWRAAAGDFIAAASGVTPHVAAAREGLRLAEARYSSALEVLEAADVAAVAPPAPQLAEPVDWRAVHGIDTAAFEAAADVQALLPHLLRADAGDGDGLTQRNWQQLIAVAQCCLGVVADAAEAALLSARVEEARLTAASDPMPALATAVEVAQARVDALAGAAAALPRAGALASNASELLRRGTTWSQRAAPPLPDADALTQLEARLRSERAAMQELLGGISSLAAQLRLGGVQEPPLRRRPTLDVGPVHAAVAETITAADAAKAAADSVPPSPLVAAPPAVGEGAGKGSEDRDTLPSSPPPPASLLTAGEGSEASLVGSESEVLLASELSSLRAPRTPPKRLRLSQQ